MHVSRTKDRAAAEIAKALQASSKTGTLAKRRTISRSSLKQQTPGERSLVGLRYRPWREMGTEIVPSLSRPCLIELSHEIQSDT